MSKERSLSGNNQRSAGLRRMLQGCAALAAMAQVFALPAAAQGPILSVQPTATMQSLAGTGALGYTGDNTAATSATLAAPAAVAYDTTGNLYIADAQNHVIRKVDTTGIITTVAGSGVEGYAGDGGLATAALLDTPSGVAVDKNGNLYIADSHNNVIRAVNASGTITTVAGTGTAGYSGDGTAATAAMLFLPQAVAVDTSGNLYIADTGNYRIRKVIMAGTITTVAGDGEQIFMGDGGSATAAGLDTPTGVAVDTSGNLYIADSHNQRIRKVSGGVITTIAGSGALGYAGDSGSATSATLAQPMGVTVDASGNVYVADSANNVIRQVSNGVINTVAGNGSQGYGGDGGAALSATLDTPRSTSLDVSGNVVIADRQNQRIRAMELPQLSPFAAQSVGSVSAPKSITISNTGGASLQVQSLSLTGSFQLASGGTCSTTTPISLAAGASCTQNLAFAPVATGPATGSVIVNGAGLTPQTVLLSGSGTQALDSLQLTGPATTVYGTGTLTATLTSGNPAATGTITFSQGSTVLGAVTLNQMAATLSTATLGVGSYNITASYSGDASDPAVNSAALPLTVTQAGTVTALTASGIPGSITNPLTLMVQVASATSGTPTGTVSFLSGTKLLGTSALNANGQAVLTPSEIILNSGTNSITAVYSGDANFTASTSAPVTLTGLDFIFEVNASLTQTVMPGQQAIYKIPISPAYGTTFPSTITFTATGLPSGATYTFAPASILAGSGPTTLVLTIQTAAVPARNILPGEPMLRHSAPIALGLLLLPLVGMKRVRRRMQRMPRILAILLFAVLGLGAAAGLGGCAGSGSMTQTDFASHSIIKVTATSSAGQGSINATLNVE